MIPFAGNAVVKIGIGLLVLGIMGVFIYRLFQRKISFMGCFTFFYLMGLICCPLPGGPRYVLPVIIPVTIYFIKWTKPVFKKAAIVIFLFLILQNIFVIASNFKFNDDDIYQKEPLEMMQWVELNIKPGEFYMFYKPRALGLMTHRLGATFWVHPQDEREWYKRIVPLHISYLVGDKQLDQFSQYNNIRLRAGNDEIYLYKIWENARYKIFKVKLLVPIS